VIDLFPLARPLLQALDPEDAHRLTVRALALGLAPRRGALPDPMLRSRVFGLDFPNPLGLAAGFDKNAEVPAAALAMGFGFAEAGTVTPRPQAGNPRPRLFRAPAQQAVLNRYGFNNEGLDAFAGRLEALRRRGWPGIVGANVGKNKDTEDAAADYEIGIRRLAPLADYLVVNVSSPNTPGLRALQGRGALSDLLQRCLDARAAAGACPPLLLKIAPDLTAEDKADIAEVALDLAIDGLIVSNTTIARPPGLPPDWAGQAGGLSGRPLFAPSTAVLADMYRLTRGQVPLVGVGGIASPADAYAKIRAGARLVQLYSVLTYQGPALVRALLDQLPGLLRADGFDRLDQAVGADHPDIEKPDKGVPSP
jgi:dihydroorotate dehydrogenase